MLKCIVVDDEPIGREGIADYITQIDYLKLMGLCKNAIEASNVLNSIKVDLIFLDIQMPKLTGLDFLRTLKNPPLVIICTAYPNFAIDGYDLNVLDYLVKPITYKRFLQAVQKAKVQHELVTTNSQKEKIEDFFFIKSDHKFIKIVKNDILFIEALENYVNIHCKEKKYLSLISLKKINSELSSNQFMQVHRSYVVNLTKINSVEGNQIVIADTKIPISRSLRKEVYDRIFQDKLLQK